MNEYVPIQQPELSGDDDDPREVAIQRAMDLRGLSRADAEASVADDAIAAREESMRQHPSAGGSNFTPRRGRYSRPPVGEDSVDVMTGIIDPQQAVRNEIGAAAIRALVRKHRLAAGTDSEAKLQRARDRARDERRGDRS